MTKILLFLKSFTWKNIVLGGAVAVLLGALVVVAATRNDANKNVKATATQETTTKLPEAENLGVVAATNTTRPESTSAVAPVTTRPANRGAAPAVNPAATPASTPTPVPATQPTVAPAFPVASNVPTRSNIWPETPNMSVTCNVSADWITLKPGQETDWYTMSTSDQSNVYWSPFYKNVIWANGVNDSPGANYWIVLDHNLGDHIATGIRFKIKVSPMAPVTSSTPSAHEEVMAFMQDSSRDIVTGCEFNFTIVN